MRAKGAVAGFVTLIDRLNELAAAGTTVSRMVEAAFTETGYLADVILPASAFPEKTGTFTNTDRMVQLGRQALALPGEARQDLAIIIEMGRRLGLDGTEHLFHPRARLLPDPGRQRGRQGRPDHEVSSVRRGDRRKGRVRFGRI